MTIGQTWLATARKMRRFPRQVAARNEWFFSEIRSPTRGDVPLPLENFFPGKPYVNRGISGQTTPQMLVRFQQDVVHLHPAAVVILAGTNDIAGNTGPSTQQMIEDNYTSMADIAKQNGIKVVLASITPAYAYPWKPGIHPVERIRD